MTADDYMEHSSRESERRAAEALERLLANGDDAVIDASILEELDPDAAAELLECFGAMRRIDDALTDGTTLPTLGDYRLVRELGRGAMGVVYEAEQISLSRKVALKVLRATSTSDPTNVQRFRNEARAAANLQHPSIVPVHAFGTEGGVHYYVMQLIDGLSLRRVLDGAREFEEGLSGAHVARAVRLLDLAGPGERGTTTIARTSAPMSGVADIASQAAMALDYAHRVGVLHRDVKPANMLVDQVGHVWVTDFGLAHFTHEASTLTASGEILGTLSYCSPEQVSGRGHIDHRSDVYALGVTLFELATRRLPFEARDRAQLIHKILHEAPLSPQRANPDVPRDLATIIEKAMAKEPQHRYQSAGFLAEDLLAYIEGRPIMARRVTRVGRVVRWARRRPGLAAAVLGLHVLALVIVILMVAGWGIADQRDRAQRAEARYEIVAARTIADKHRRSFAPGRRAAALVELDNAVASVGAADLAAADEAALLSELRRDVLDTLAVTDATMRELPSDRCVRAVDAQGEYCAIQEEGAVRIVRLADGKEMAAMITDSPDMRCRFDESGEWLHALDMPRARVRIWHWPTDKDVELPDGFVVRSTDCMPDGKTVLGLMDGRLAVGTPGQKDWRVVTAGQRLVRPDVLQLGPNGRYLCIVSWGRRDVQVVDLVGGEPVRRLVASGAVWDAAWRPDGKEIALVGDSRLVEVMDLTGKRTHPPMAGHLSSATLVDWDATGTLVISSGWDHVLHVWNVASGEPLIRQPLYVTAIERGREAGRIARIYSKEGTVVDIDRNASPVQSTIHAQTRAAWVHPDGCSVVVATPQAFEVYDVETLARLAAAPVRLDSVMLHASLAWLSPDRFVASHARGASVYSFTRGEAGVAIERVKDLDVPRGGANQVAATPDGKVLVYLGRTYVHVFEGENLELTARIKHGCYRAEQIHVSPDGRWVTFGMHGGKQVPVLDLDSELVAFTAHDLYPGARACFSPDGLQVAFSDSNETVILATGSWEVQHRLVTDKSDRKSTVGWLPDMGGFLLNDPRDRVRILDTEDMSERYVLSARPRSDVFSYSFSRDGQVVVGTSLDQVFIWRLGAIERELAARGLR